MTEIGIERLRDVVKAAFDAEHRNAHGTAPCALHAWIEGGAILLVARAAAATEPAAGRSLQASLAELQHATVHEVYLRTGELLHAGGRCANAERGLLVLAFERVGAAELVAEPGSKSRAPLAEPS